MWFFKKPISKIIEEQGKEICQRCHALGVAEGIKIKDGKSTGEKAIVFLVKEKLPKTQLLSSEIIPAKIGGHKTDVIEAKGEILPMSGHRTKHRPIIGGISGMVEGGTACSIGLVVYRDRMPGILTNEHCFAYPSGQNNVYKSFTQPSFVDGGRIPSDIIGRGIDPPSIKNNQQNKIDSIFIPIDIPFELKVRKIPNYTKKWAEPKVGMRFRKPSRTTDYTEGTISYVNALSKVNYGGSLGVCEFYPTVWTFQNNHDIVDGGDSGSCCFDEQGNVIMQTFAAAPNLAIFMPFSSIVEELGITLDLPQSLEGYIAIGKDWFSHKEVLVNKLNFRKEPRITAEIIKVLNRGDKIEVLEYGGFVNNYHWLKVLSR